MTIPAYPAGLSPPHSPSPQAAAGRPCCRPHFSAWESIYRPERGTHFCTTWSGPHGLRGRVPPRRAGMKLTRGPGCSSSPGPWHLTTHSLSRSGASTKAPPDTQASFPHQELTSEFTKVALNTPQYCPPPEAFVYPTWPQSGESGEWGEKGYPPIRAGRKRSSHTLQLRRKGECDLWYSGRGPCPRRTSPATIQLPEYMG